MMSRRERFASVAIGLAVSTPAAALEYCVTCEGPPAMYRCVIAGTPEGPGNAPSSSLFCISEMAARGHHERCAVSRGAPFPCPGLTAEVDEPAGGKMAEPPPEHAPDTPPQHDASHGPHEPHAAPKETATPAAPPGPAPVPRTVEELATETVKSSKEGIKKAGEAIGGTAKKAGEQIGNAGSAIGSAASKTWSCLSSFFTDCTGESSNGSNPAPETEPPAKAPEAD